MGLYARHVFPWLIDKLMARDVLEAQRRIVLAEAQGTVLEIGFGTGLNAPHYSKQAKQLWVLDTNPGMYARARRRADAAAVPVSFLAPESPFELPLGDASCDTVVSTWTLCSVPAPARTLAEVHRVLRPGGRFVFIEHGRAPEARLAKWQRRMNCISRRIGDGCHLDRDFTALLASSPLAVERCETFYMPDTPRIGGFTYRGWALKPGSADNTGLFKGR